MKNTFSSQNFILQFLIILLFTFGNYTIILAQGNDSVSMKLDEFFTDSNRIKYESSEAAIKKLKQTHKELLQKGDTLKSIDALMQLADVYGHRADYASSYDVFWQSLFLADKIKNDSLDGLIAWRLGRFYSFYKREEESLKYLNKALSIRKNMVQEGNTDPAYLVHNYFAFVSTYRELDMPELASTYLDSCLIYYKEVENQVPMSQLNFEKAFILSRTGQNQKALELLKSIEPWFLENRPSYMVLVYTYWGDVLQNTGDLNSSVQYYEKAIAVSEKYKNHIDFTPLIYERLTEHYKKQGNYQKAYENLKIAKELDALFFDGRSSKNKSMLEIRDEFRIEKQRQSDLIQKQRFEKLQQEEHISMLQRVILLGTIVFILILAFFFFRHLRNKHKLEKQLIRRNKELEIQKTNELLELKNKELAASVLQLVEKDEFLKELKEKLKSNKDNLQQSEVNKLLRTISVSNNNNWEEFRLRFTAVNEKFYKKLTEKYPKLTQSDHKICALIKLNFSSKDMARLLGISVESVHTTRYRLRKKLQLERKENLEDFIAQL
ncbi:tetratricopeptide repeat protein [Maribacter sp. 6B07]|uniref:Tetratricopeptide repeat-containing protein n=2 Tax=Flavobacteriaceae TaxID=49546 RepID=A0A1H4U897_9FLAO|nr:tetratricopeptide repeat protein [Maribacter sp. 6B07]SDS10251.1 Tetratricopeptide repeat-containing protein [Maribacter dokdonensis]SEC64927.1 Tetratricopeptide repeat-containing protein [Maribacter dokdonensis]